MDIEPGTYRTRNGYKAHVWEKRREQNTERLLWQGTIEDAGINVWDAEGKDACGYTGFDLVERVEDRR